MREVAIKQAWSQVPISFAINTKIYFGAQTSPKPPLCLLKATFLKFHAKCIHFINLNSDRLMKKSKLTVFTKVIYKSNDDAIFRCKCPLVANFGSPLLHVDQHSKSQTTNSLKASMCTVLIGNYGYSVG